MSDLGFEAMIERIVRRVLAQERATTPAAVAGFIGTREAARRASVQPDTIRDWIASGILPAAKPKGVRGFRIRPSDLDAVLMGRNTGAQPLDFVAKRAARLAASIQRNPAGDS